MKEGRRTRIRLLVAGLAGAAVAVAAVPAGSARVPIPEEPEVMIGERIDSQTAKLTPVATGWDLVSVRDSRSGAELYRFKKGNRYSIPFE
jgi:hypothetical protein